MITDLLFVSARAEKQNGLGRRLVRGILTASAAVALTLPSLAAWGLEGGRNAPIPANAFEQIALPPIPYLDSMPWLMWDAGAPSKVDTLLAPLPEPWGLNLAPDARDKGKPAIS
jgi:hypothetical protein